MVAMDTSARKRSREEKSRSRKIKYPYIQPEYSGIMVHDQKKYDVWEKFYHYTCSDKIDKTKMEINLKPNPHRVAEVPLFFFDGQTVLLPVQ